MKGSDTFYVLSVNLRAYVMPINTEETYLSIIVDSGSSGNKFLVATFRKTPGLKLRSCNSRVYAYASRNRPRHSVRNNDRQWARSAQIRTGRTDAFHRRFSKRLKKNVPCSRHVEKNSN